MQHPKLFATLAVGAGAIALTVAATRAPDVGSTHTH